MKLRYSTTSTPLTTPKAGRGRLPEGAFQSPHLFLCSHSHNNPPTHAHQAADPLGTVQQERGLLSCLTRGLEKERVGC